MDLQQNIEATIADFNLNDMPARRTAKRIMQLIKDFNQSQETSEADVRLNNLLVAEVYSALRHLKDDHVQNNLHRLGPLGEQDVESAIRTLELILTSSN